MHDHRMLYALTAIAAALAGSAAGLLTGRRSPQCQCQTAGPVDDENDPLKDDWLLHVD